MSYIIADTDTITLLAETDRTLQTVPVKGEQVRLKKIGNISAGGTSTDVTDIVHPANKMIAERIAKIVGLDVCGIDVICADITLPLGETGGAVVEVNSAPGFRLHMEPAEGTPRDVAKDMFEMLFPQTDDAFIPIVATLCSDANIAENIASHLYRHLQQQGKVIGRSTPSGIYLDELVIKIGDGRTFESGQFLLREPVITHAIIASSTSSIISSGLPFTYSNVAVIAPTEQDREDKTFPKAAAAVASTIRPSGYLVIDAGILDIASASLITTECKGTVVWVNLEDNKDLAKHLNSPAAADLEGNQLVLRLPGNDVYRRPINMSLEAFDDPSIFTAYVTSTLLRKMQLL